MKILLVSEPGLDGVLRHVEGLANHLVARGDEVSLAYSDRRPSDRLFQLLAALSEKGCATVNLHVGNAPECADFRAFWTLRRFVRQQRPDVIHAHSSKAGFLVRALRLLGERTPIFYTPNAYYCMNVREGLKPFVFHTAERMLGLVGTTINTGKGESEFAEQTLRIAASRRCRIANGVDCARFRPAQPEDRALLRDSLGIPPGAVALGSVGRYSAQKDPLTMYRAFLHARRSIPNLFLLHLGRGELEAQINSFVEQHGLAPWVRRIPYLADPVSFYQALDGFLISSVYEGLSYAVLEALGANLPLILTRCPGNEDFDDYGLSHTFWAFPSDERSLAAAIVHWQHEVPRAINHREVALRDFEESQCCDKARAQYLQALRTMAQTSVPSLAGV